MNFIAWSSFALKENTKNPVFSCTPEHLLVLVQSNWNSRTPGAGRTDLSKVVLVPIPDLSIFTPQWIHISQASDFQSIVTKRSGQDHEDSYIETTAKGTPLPISKAFVVCYSKEALLENNGTRSSNAEWEIVAVIASSWDSVPMMPLTMARNYLHKPGGTFAPYTAEQLAESIYFWSQYVKYRP